MKHILQAEMVVRGLIEALDQVSHFPIRGIPNLCTFLGVIQGFII
jgi:hypothetical protein